MVSTPTLSRRSDVSSPKTPLDFLSPSASLKRKGPVALTSHTGTLAENDDAAEKRQRLLSRVTALALQSPVSTTPKSASRLNGVDGSTVSGSTGLTNVQLKDLYSNCIKLSTENKINAKNAFGLHLIDYMQEFLTNLDKDQGVTNFQIASCTLDAGAKIYAGRVDSIHAQAYKMLGGLGRAENTSEGGEGSSGGPQDEGSQTAKKKKAHRTARTIETNLNSINVDQFDLEFEVDPLFHKTSASFDEGGTRGLLLNHLSCRDDSCETLLDSNTITTPTMADFDWGNSQTSDLSDLKEMEKRIWSQTTQICPHFADFCFTNWDKNAENVRDCETPVNKTNEHAFDMDAPVAFEDPMNNIPDIGNGGFSDDDGDDQGPCTNMTMSATLGFADGQEAQIVLTGQLRSEAMTAGSVAQTVGNLVLSLSSEQSEYSYFKDNILGMWAGPEHWKNRATFNALKGMNKNGTKTKQTGVKKEPFRIAFDATHDFDKLFSTGKASTVLAKSTLEKHSSTQNTLPEDLHYDYNSLLKLFLKPKLFVRRQYGVQPELTDDGNGNDWYDYGNPNDCANYCPDVQDDDGDNDVSGGDMRGFHEDSSQEMSQALSSFNSNETVFHGDNLVAQPNRVQKIDIGYAKTAKKIDVKKLKKGMWEIMLTSSPGEDEQADKENVPDISSSELADGEVNKNVITKPCSFSNLYTKIPSKISKNMAKSLSVPIAFVCLLHLANEKTLKILGQISMEDFSITQGI